MSTFPGSPCLLKGAIVGVDPLIPIPNVVVFQYNSDTMTRRLEPRWAASAKSPGTSCNAEPGTRNSKGNFSAFRRTDQGERGFKL